MDELIYDGLVKDVKSYLRVLKSKYRRQGKSLWFYGQELQDRYEFSFWDPHLSSTNPVIIPPDFFLLITLTNNEEYVSLDQSFFIGTDICKKEVAQDFFDEDDFELMMNNQYYSEEETQEKARELAGLLIMDGFSEWRVDITDNIGCIPKQGLIHEFYLNQDEELLSYIGSEINLRTEHINKNLDSSNSTSYAKNIQDLSIDLNIALYYTFMENLKS